VSQYRKRPVVIEAVQWGGDNINEIWDAFGASCIHGPTEINPDSLVITTLEGDMRAPKGWWVIKGVLGELYPCAPDVFDATYEPVEAKS
jgi:hypothetical protein